MAQYPNDDGRQRLIPEHYTPGYARYVLLASSPHSFGHLLRALLRFLELQASGRLNIRVQTVPTLEERIQSLAQELQDMILDYTLLIEPTTVNITDRYQPPWQLSVNRRTRPLVAEHYYSTSTSSDMTRLHDLQQWLDRIPAEYVQMIENVEFGVRNMHDAKKWLKIYTRSLEQHWGIVLAPGVLRAWFKKHKRSGSPSEWVYVSWKDAAALDDREMRAESFYAHSRPWEGREVTL
ncbi:unnamed protein product [Cercospora beticola]|nr:unnamed protein product [Cercospora beticola]